jgi:hypothetical protein
MEYRLDLICSEVHRDSHKASFLMLLWFGTANSIVAWLSAVVASNIKLAFFWLFIVITLIFLVANTVAVPAVPS